MPSARNCAEQRDGKEDALRIGGGFAAHDGHACLLRQFIETVVNAGHVVGIEFLRQRERDERGRGRAR